MTFYNYSTSDVDFRGLHASKGGLEWDERLDGTVIMVMTTCLLKLQMIVGGKRQVRGRRHNRFKEIQGDIAYRE